MSIDVFEIDIPTKNYIKKYMESMHGSPISITRSDRHGKLLFQLMDRSSHERDTEYPKYTTTMRVQLKAKYYHRRGTNLTMTSIIEFNNTVEQDVKMLLRTFVYAQMTAPTPRKKKHAIEEFMRVFKFGPTDFPYETAKKDIDRNLDGLFS